MTADNVLIFRFIRFADKSRAQATDAVLSVTPMKKGYKLEYNDPNLEHHQVFQLGSTQRLLDYLNNAINLATIDSDETGRFQSLQISLPRFPDTMIPLDSNVTIKFGKVVETITKFHATK